MPTIQTFGLRPKVVGNVTDNVSAAHHNSASVRPVAKNLGQSLEPETFAKRGETLRTYEKLLRSCHRSPVASVDCGLVSVLVRRVECRLAGARNEKR